MTDPSTAPPVTKRLARRVFAPVFTVVDAARVQLEELRTRQEEAAAALEQLSRQVERLEAYQQVTRDELRREYGALVAQLPGAGEDTAPAEALRLRLDQALLHAESLADESRRIFAHDLAELRSATRLTQAMAERASAVAGRPPAPSGGAEDRPSTPQPLAPSGPWYTHPSPSFDLLYRAFEDRHRGDPESISERQREDYLDLLSGLGHEQLPIVDLGCGRGELVRLLTAADQAALGVDSNLGQVVDGEPELFVEDDLFRWLDDRSDESCRAVVSMHVVEHLSLELQVRLVFEARRVLADGGMLVLETPNTLSLSTAATNFWVDPTHARPVHPMFLEFLAQEAGFSDVRTLYLHELPIGFRGRDSASELVDDLDSLIFGAGDLALVATR